MKKSFKGKSKNILSFEENEKALLCNVFTKKKKNLKKKLKSKKLYNIPVKIIKISSSSSRYLIVICKSVENLKKDEEYYCCYDLLKKCSEVVWNKFF